MSGFAAFLRKELTELRHTWRIWVLPGFLLFSAVSSPLLLYVLPTLVDRLGGAGDVLTIDVSQATATDVYKDYLGNLGELVLFVIIIAYGGLVSGELRAGTGQLALAKPLSRSAFVVAKWVSQAFLLLVGGALASAACVAVTAVLFDAGPAAGLLLATGLWVTYAVMFLAVMLLLSVVVPAPVGAAGAGLGVYAALTILGLFDTPTRYSPAGLPAAMQDVVAGVDATVLAPLLSAAATTAVMIVVAVSLFRRREI